jgi:hypothetical protein
LSAKASIAKLKTNARLCVAYDNFQYYQRVGAQRLGEFDELRQFTTGKLFLGGDIPDGGLHQNLLNKNVELEVRDIMCAAGNQHDEVQNQISRFFIAKAISQVYPTSVDHIFNSKQTDLRYPLPKMPELDILPPEVTPSTTLGPITAEEGSIDGNYQVLEDIFLCQLSLDKEKDFSSRLFPIYGDQLTVSRLRSLQVERNEAEFPYDRHNWLVQVPSFFHVLMNLLWLINRSHYGDPDTCNNVYSALSIHAQVLNRKKIPKDAAPFEHLEDIAIHSFYARIVALLHVRMKELLPSCDIHDPEIADNYIRSLYPRQFLALVEDIRNLAFSDDIRISVNRYEPKVAARSKAKPKKAESPKVDEEFVNHVRFLQEMETYCTLKYAVQHGDVGHLMRIIPRLCLYFHGGPAKNYAREMLYLWRLLSTDACTPTLRQAILRNGLVNKTGKPDGWMPIDLFVEYLNLELKLIIYDRRNGTFGVDELFNDCVLLCDYVSSLRKEFERNLSRPISGRHTSKDFKKDVRYLADLIFAEGSITPTKARSCPHQSLNLVGKGKDAIYSGAISTFNQHLSDSRGPENSSHQADGKDADTLEDSDDGNVKAIDNVCNADNASEDFDGDIPQADAHFYSIMVLFSPLKLLTIRLLIFYLQPYEGGDEDDDEDEDDDKRI